MFEEIIKFGRELFVQGLNNSHSGNISIRRKNLIYITKHSARLGSLSSQDIVYVNLKDDKKDKQASIETKVHRAIYLAIPHARTIVHAHPPYAVTLSLNYDIIIPDDMEGKYYLPEIPVLSKCEDTISSDCVVQYLPPLFETYNLVVIKGHGTFAIGKSLEEAYLYTSVCESASKIMVLNKLLKLSNNVCSSGGGF